MRIAILSDIHGNLTALEAVLADLQGERIDQMVCLGDLAFKGPQPGECVARVRGLGIPCIHGNTDLSLLEVAGLTPTRPLPPGNGMQPDAEPYFRWHVEHMGQEELAYLASLPFSYRMESDGQSILFVHASPQDVIAGIRPTMAPEAIRTVLAGAEADWIVVGHVHEAFAFRFEGRWLVNPGAIGFSLDGDGRAAYAVLDTARSSFELRRVAYSYEAAVAAARDRGYCFDPDWYGQALRKGFWEPIPYQQRREIDRFPR
jgi:putative phosphoesterase